MRLALAVVPRAVELLLFGRVSARCVRLIVIAAHILRSAYCGRRSRVAQLTHVSYANVTVCDAQLHYIIIECVSPTHSHHASMNELYNR